MSKVCTHRGFILLDAPQPAGTIRCRYHGRCFNPDGSFRSMPMFEGAENFPTAMDHLRPAATQTWNDLLFGAIHPDRDLAAVLQPLQDRLYWFPFGQLRLREDLSKTYEVKAHWALYCENYLEGLHIPFVHQSLNKVLDFGQYETHIFDHCNLQLGIANSSEPAFELPEGAPDYGKRVAAYYWWIFPNLMLNVYPWGISVNVVEPQGVDRTRVRFLTYVSDEQLLGQGAGNNLDAVELEDEWVVERVHLGTASRLYHSGRYSPGMEKGVYHFHELLRSRI
jgi:choline monooxygenase